ncbi:hypothetical protein ACP4OV_015213 [Aristida adscensionis]
MSDRVAWSRELVGDEAIPSLMQTFRSYRSRYGESMAAPQAGNKIAHFSVAEQYLYLIHSNG